MLGRYTLVRSHSQMIVCLNDCTRTNRRPTPYLPMPRTADTSLSHANFGGINGRLTQRLECHLHTVEVTGSNPVSPIKPFTQTPCFVGFPDRTRGFVFAALHGCEAVLSVSDVFRNAGAALLEAEASSK